MHWSVRLILGSSSLFVVQCTPVLQGVPVDLAEIAKPDLIKEAPAPVVPVATPAPHGQIRAWIPRVVAPNGDVTDGHYVEISAGPVQESVAPSLPIPRPPKVPLIQPRAAHRKTSPAPANPHVADPGLPASLPTPGFAGPPGMPFLLPGGAYEPVVP